MPIDSNLKFFDPEVAETLNNEHQRQLNKLELIASENIVSQRVLEATGSIMTNKYAEGYPAKRYYGGCEHVDITENLAIERAKELFKAEHVNVQPHSGSQANMGVYMSVMEPGDVVLGMDLSHGGHLTHGSPVNFSGFIYKPVFYRVRKEDQRIDYDEMIALAKEHKPKLIIAGASAYSRVIDFEKFRIAADESGAYLLVDMAHIAGLVASGHHPSPVPYADFVTTTTHKTLRGPRGGMIFSTEKMNKKINSRIFPGIQGGPLCHVIAAKAVALKEALSPGFHSYIEQTVQNAAILASSLVEKGYQITTGGTDNHLMLLDLRNTDITGKEAERILDRCNITVNKNSVPFETRSPFITSGIRLGTPALTSRGLVEKDILQVADYIDQILNHRNDEQKLDELAQLVKNFSSSFPEFHDICA